MTHSQRIRSAWTALLLAVSLGAHAADPGVGYTAGEVRRIDRDQGRITLRHGEIRNLDMPPMTMEFRLREAAQAEGLKPGDKVRFKAAKDGSAFVVTDLQRGP